MTHQTFEETINNRNILWNDMVILTIYNPQYKGKNRWWQFWKPVIPRFITIEGAICYQLNDNVVSICVEDSKYKTKKMYFEFNEIFDINILWEH